MYILALLIHTTGAYPLWKALQANRRTTLYHTLWWSVAAWASWGVLMVASMTTIPGADLMLLRYVALALTGCAGVAVLGARRPIVGAWNLVIVGLLAVMLLPLAERVILRQESFELLRVAIVAGAIVVAVLNYLPTCLAGSALLLASGCGWELYQITRAENLEQTIQVSPGWFFLALVPWAAWLGWMRQRPASSEFDRSWRAFRNRFGLFWSQRVREQFNRAAENASWPVRLHWRGLYLREKTEFPEREKQTEILETLQALLKRFARKEEGQT